MSRAGRDGLWVWVEAAALLLFLALSLRGFPLFVDLHMADEVFYRLQGQYLLAGERGHEALALAPVYSVFYGLVDLLLGTGGMVLQDWMAGLWIAAAIFSLWWALRALVQAPVAFCATAFWVGSAVVLNTSLYPRCNVYLFTAVLHFLALGTMARGRLLLALTLLTLAGLNRVELAPWLLFTSVAVALSTRKRAVAVGAWASTALAGLMLLLHAAFRGAREHSWGVFSWHFAIGRIERGIAESDASPMAYHVEITREVFGDTTSIFEAVLREPLAFGGHLLHNVAILPTTIADTFGHPFDSIPLLSVLVLCTALGLALVGLRRRPLPDEPELSRETRWMMVLGCLFAMPVALLVRPRVELLLPCIPLVTVVVARLADRGLALLSPRPWRCPRLPALLLLGVTVLMPWPLPPNRVRSRPMREARTILEQHEMDAEARLFASFGSNLLYLAGREDTAIALDGTAVQPQAVREGDHLLLTLVDRELYGDRVLESWYADLHTGRWRLLEGGLEVWLFERVQ